MARGRYADLDVSPDRALRVMRLHRVGLLIAGVGLSAASVGLAVAGTRNRHNADRDRELSAQAVEKGHLLASYFERARTVLLLSAQNPAFVDFYDAPGTREEKVAAGGATMARVQAALVYLESLYPSQVLSEVCFIHGSGPENARVVGAHVALASELSANESGNVFFTPTLALAPGDVYQAAPYVSPDTHEWVVSSSTRLPLADQNALLHVEVSLDSFRAALASEGTGDAVVVDSQTGVMVLDAGRALTVGGALTQRGDRVYAELAHGSAAGITTLRGERLAYRHIETSPGNVNDWLVVARAPADEPSPIDGIGWAPALILLAGVSVLGFALSSFRASQRRLRSAALTDRLTGLANRAQLQEQIAEGIAVATRGGQRAAVLMVDLDRFKDVNDSLGHHHGDLVLVETARRLASAVRHGDAIARLGGDEFAVYLRGAADRDAVAAAQRIVEAIAQPFFIDGLPIRIGASVGVALFPNHGMDAASLLQHADVAMYQAKRARSGHRVYDPDHDDSSQRRLHLASELNTAISGGRLVVHYQPKVDLSTGNVTGVEALVRWNHETHGLITPDEFISIAEDTGLIKALTLEVLDQALRQCRAWHDHGSRYTVAVNLSARCLAGDDLPAAVVAALHKWALDGGALVLELTESAIIDDYDHAASILQTLHQFGVKLSIDDFGTGYFSMSGLRNLPIDELKIDRGFVSTMISEEKDAFIVQSTIALGHSLGISVVAEGVEDATTLDALRSLGCDTAQGYFISRPLPTAEIHSWLSAHERGQHQDWADLWTALR